MPFDSCVKHGGYPFVGLPFGGVWKKEEDAGAISGSYCGNQSFYGVYQAAFGD